MFSFSDIVFEQKNIIEEIRKKNNHILMSHSFSTLFLWKETLRLSIHLEDDFFVVKYALLGDDHYFFPCGNILKTKQFIDWLNDSNIDYYFHYLRREDMCFLRDEYEGCYDLNYDSVSCEYIYDKNVHISLNGGRFTKNRYEQKQLFKKYKVRIEKISHNNYSAAKEIIDAWKGSHDARHLTEIYDDCEVSYNILKYFDELNFCGVIILIDDTPWAVGAAAPISDDTYCVQLAKTKSPLLGLTPVLWTEVFKQIPDSCKWVNGDDDLGIEGIKIQKKKLSPDRMNEVWIAKKEICLKDI